jgi:hypothetical protein
MLRRYRDRLIFAVTILGCFLVVGLWGQDPPAKPSPTVTLKPGDEVKPLELESAKLGKLKAQIARDEAQENELQARFSNLEVDKRTLQANLDALVSQITARVKKETGGVELVYDPRTGEDGTFHVNTVPASPTAAAKTR